MIIIINFMTNKSLINCLDLENYIIQITCIYNNGWNEELSIATLKNRSTALIIF